MMGYLVSALTAQQKMFLIVGPKRSGKGTIGRVIRSLVGANRVRGLTFAVLGERFGLAPLIHANVAIMSDARLGGRTDKSAVAERLLSISGEETLTIDRKHKDPWTGKLGTRILILTNELPALVDASGAFASRFIAIELTQSFYGREDPSLTDRLLQELPGILNWALDGLDRLEKRGHFKQPSHSQDLMRDFEDRGSPIRAFVRDCCTKSSGFEVSVKDFSRAYQEFCISQNFPAASDESLIGRDLRSIVPGLETRQRRIDGVRVRHFVGIKLK